jgi:hypothetical protein
MSLMAEAMITTPTMAEPNTQDPTARASPQVPAIVTTGEGEATPPASPVLLRMGKWNSTHDWNVYTYVSNPEVQF